jgi:MFS family permease
MDRQARREVSSLLAAYWSFGQFWGVWVILVLDFQTRHRLSDSRLALRYTLLSATAIVFMVFVAPRLHHIALSVTCTVALLSLGIGSVGLALLPGPLLLAGFLMSGVGNGLVDVYLNVAAQRSEVRNRRPVLQWLHACYALGGLTGAALAGLIGVLELDFRIGQTVAGVALFMTAWLVSRNVSHEESTRGTQTSFSLSAFARSPVLMIPAFGILAAFLVEGSMDTWSGLYVRREIGASSLGASLAFVTFSASLFLGRLFAGRVLFGLGPRRTILISGVGAAAGGTIAAMAHSPVPAAAGFLIMGFAIAAAAPAAFGLIEASDEHPAAAIAAVTAVGYSGFVWSPPIFGWLAEAFSLRAAMTAIVCSTLGLIATGLLAPKRPVPAGAGGGGPGRRAPARPPLSPTPTG